MPVDYSKWDALELSDDSDIEVHPNVDKRSFIRAKQNQIHQQRAERKHQIETLKYERIINDGLLTRIDRLLQSLQSHKEDAEKAQDGIERYVFEALFESAGNPDDDTPPPPPPGVHANVKEQPTYSKMMAALVDQVKKAVDESKDSDRYGAFIKEVGSHKTHVQDLQQQLLAKLAELEKEEKGKITSENIHTGFDSSFVSRDKPSVPSGSSAQATKTSSQPELLNPARPRLQSRETGQSSGADADVEDEALLTRNPIDPDASDDEDMKASPLAKKFAKIKFGDYRSSLQFISENPSVLGEKETDGLLVEAFNAQTENKDEFARQCVHQALLLQYCRQLGRDGVQLFFKRIMTPNHQAQKLFLDDVNSTYARIRTRTKELAEQRKRDEAEGTGGVEQIQLHAVDPNTTINIVVPSADATEEGEKLAREIFESFPPGLQRALESGSLDKVNEVLGKMSVDEAEEVVEKLGQGGMLSLEEGVIDATTEEGRQQMEEIERSGRMPGRVVEEIEDPGMD
ncbi:hsp90 co-chaperone Cdc37 [Taxawa tesnikishii (nom. ined.)]|nr:hsp90 co-chaperone Cdc37 [Dothideales sp. JES 119]